MNKSNAATERVHRTNEEDEDNWEVHAGDVVTGVIVRIDPDEILVDIGCKAEGVLSTNEVPEIGLFAFSHLRERDKILVYVLEPETQDGHAHLSIKRVPDIAFIAGGFDETFLTPLAAAVHYAARETRKEDGQVTNYEGETTAMAQAFRKAVHKQKDTSTSQERRATMTQWPNVHAANKGIVVPGTAVAPPLSNEAVIRRIEHAAATSLVE